MPKIYERYLIIFEEEDLDQESFSKSANYWLEDIKPKLIFFNHLLDPHPVSPNAFHPEMYVVGEFTELSIDDIGIKAKFFFYDTLPERLKKNVEDWSIEIEEIHDFWLSLVQEKFIKNILGFSVDGIQQIIKREKQEGLPTSIKSWGIPFASLTHHPAQPLNIPDVNKQTTQKDEQPKGDMNHQEVHGKGSDIKNNPLPETVMQSLEPVIQVLKDTMEFDEEQIPYIIFNLLEQKKVLNKMATEDLEFENENLDDVEPEDDAEMDVPESEDDGADVEVETEETYVKTTDLEEFLEEYLSKREKKNKPSGKSTTIGAFKTTTKSAKRRNPVTRESKAPLIDSFKAIKSGDLRQMKALGISTGVSGGYMVQPEYSNDVIDLLQDNSIFLNGGAAQSLVRFVPMVSDVMNIPVVESTGTGYWIGENTAITDSEPTFGLRRLTAKKLAAIMPISNELLADSLPEFETIIKQDLARGMANDVDQAILTGQGGGEPLGIVNQTGITSTALNAAPTYANLIDLITRIEQASVTLNDSARWVFNPREKGTFRKLESTSDDLIWTDTNFISRTGQAGVPATLVGYGWLASNNVLLGTNGNAANESNIFFGNWDEVIVGMRKELEFKVSDQAESAFRNDQTLIRAILRMDVVVAHPAAIQVLEDVQV